MTRILRGAVGSLMLSCLTFGPAFANGAPCPGDCSGDRVTTVDEIVLAVGIALGTSPLATCPTADADGDGMVTVDEILRAVDAALAGCESTIPPFEEFAWESELADPRTDRLCVEAAAPDRVPETTFIQCRIEGAKFAPSDVPPKDELTIVAYNIERGFGIDAQLAAILEHGDIPVPDVILLSEADRGCQRTGLRNITREYAEALGAYYVFATEFVELPGNRAPGGPYDPPLCEHGNAILSRYPLGNVRAIRHAANRSWYTPPGHPNPDEPRLGGRIAVAADMKVGDRLVRLYSLHLESTLSTLRVRDAQALEIAVDADAIRGPVIVGGDLNAFFAKLDFANGTRNDATTQVFLQRGFVDAHAPIPLEQRDTIFDPVPLVIDFVLVRDARVRSAGLCPSARCGGLSDHLPIWALVDIGPNTAR